MKSKLPVFRRFDQWIGHMTNWRVILNNGRRILNGAHKVLYEKDL